MVAAMWSPTVTMIGATEVPIHALVDGLFRRESGRLTALLVRSFGPDRIDLAEDVVQETLLTALRQWPYRGVPENPSAWLTRVARNRALDLLRREAVAKRLAPSLSAGDVAPPEVTEEIADDDLRMMFVCCHPALSRDQQVALVLKLMCGMSVSEIARAFLAEEKAIAQRIVRAKRALRAGLTPFEIPCGPELVNRLDAVLQALYLLFNEGYSAHAGENAVRADVCFEAIRLATVLQRSPTGDTPRTHALLALMQFQASRLGSRTDALGDLLLLDEQDRSLWDQELIQQGFRHLERAAQGDSVSTYHLEAGIAAVHAGAATYSETDWQGALTLYDALLEMTGSPIVALNRAVALWKAAGPGAALAEVRRLTGEKALRGYHLLDAVAGALYAELGDAEASKRHYEMALERANTAAERRFLEKRLSGG